MLRLFKCSKEVWAQANRCLEQVTATNKQFANRHRQEAPKYRPSDRVWLSTQDIRNIPGCRKLSSHYFGPFKVLRQINPVFYRLALPRHWCLVPNFHVSQLKLVMAGPLDADSPPAMPPAPVEHKGQPAYAVKGLLKSLRRLGQLQYLVDWEGYGPEEQCWVPACDILDLLLINEKRIVKYAMSTDNVGR